MRKKGIEQLRGRIVRVANRCQEKAGPGFAYSATLPDGRVQNYEITNIRDLDDLEDDVATWCVWLWSLKDYVRNAAKRAGKPDTWWKEKVEASQALQFCADLANRGKHEKLTQEWTNLHLEFGPAKFTMPQTAMASLTLGAGSATIDTADPELVEYEVPILNGSGTRVGDALEVLSEATDAWNAAIAGLGSAS